MLLRTQCRVRVIRKSVIYTQWQRVPARCYTSGSDDPPWFLELRTEMLNRDPTYTVEDITSQPGEKLSHALQGFLPVNWCRAPNYKRPVLPISHYLIWFNPSLPQDRLLPDGTDMLHSPGGPWVRRMWAGGSVTVKPVEYSSKKSGFALQSAVASAERIKDVQLRGKDEDVKIFVTLERQYARVDRLYERHRRAHGNSEKTNGLNVQHYFKKQLQDDTAWDDAIFKDERTLVFLKERSAAELEAIKAGQKISPKYLDPPRTSDFSHKLNPTRSLLFRYSALTFNAHAIHLDQAYAREVEGHRSLLVHGPLSLTIMLQAISGYLNTEMKGQQVFESIEYRNLAPLYCHEEMRVCGRLKKELRDGNIYDVWIEGAPGGVAVKGVVRTAARRMGRVSGAAHSSRSEGKQPSRTQTSAGAEPDSPRKENTVNPSSEEMVEETPENFPDPEQARPTRSSALKTNQSNKYGMTSRRATLGTGRSLRRQSDKRIREVMASTKAHEKASATTAQPFMSRNQTVEHISSTAPNQPLNPLAHRTQRRNPATRVKSHTFMLPTSTFLSIRQVPGHPSPVKPRTSSLARNIMNRSLARRNAQLQLSSLIKPIPILRKHGAAPYKPNPDLTASRHSRFKREGVKYIEQTPIRAVAQNMEKLNDEEVSKAQEYEARLRRRMEEERREKEYKLRLFDLWMKKKKEESKKERSGGNMVPEDSAGSM